MSTELEEKINHNRAPRTEKERKKMQKLGLLQLSEKKRSLGFAGDGFWRDGGGSANDGIFLGIRCVCEIRKTKQFILGERRKKVTRGREQ